MAVTWRPEMTLILSLSLPLLASVAHRALSPDDGHGETGSSRTQLLFVFFFCENGTEQHDTPRHGTARHGTALIDLVFVGCRLAAAARGLLRAERAHAHSAKGRGRGEVCPCGVCMCSVCVRARAFVFGACFRRAGTLLGSTHAWSRPFRVRSLGVAHPPKKIQADGNHEGVLRKL